MKTTTPAWRMIELIAAVGLAAGSAWGEPPADGDYSNKTVTIESEENWGSNSWIGDEGDNNTVTVQTTGGNLTVTGGLHVGGQGGSQNTLDVLSGGQVSATNYVNVGHEANADHNAIKVDGDSSLSAGAWMIVGRHGANSTMTVSDGASVSADGNFHVGFNVAANHSSLIVDNGTVTNSGAFFTVGNSSSDSSMLIRNEGTVTATSASSGLRIGGNTGADNNWVEVVGPGSALETSHYSWVGGYGQNNTLRILDGATFSGGGGMRIGRYDSSTGNTLLVDGTSGAIRSTFNATYLDVGYAGSNNEATVSGGALIYVDDSASGTTDIGSLSNNNVLTVTGEDSHLYSSGTISVSSSGQSNNRLIVEHEGSVQGDANLAVNEGGTVDISGGTVNVNGDFSFNAGSTYRLSLHDNTATPIEAGGEVTLETGDGVSFVLGNMVYDPSWADFVERDGATPGTMFTVLEYGAIGNLIGTFDGILHDDTLIQTPDGEWEFVMHYAHSPGGTDDYRIALELVTIPEPHTMGLILLGLGAVALRRRLHKT